MTTLTNTVNSKIATTLKRTLDHQNPDHKHKPKENLSLGYSGATQDCIPIKKIINGIYLTDDNRYLGLVEFLPTTYTLKPLHLQEALLKNFSSLFTRKPYKWQLKIMNETGDCADLIENLKKNCRNQDDPVVSDSLNAYINFIRTLVNNGSCISRFFFIWEFSGIEGKFDYPEEDIVQNMCEIRREIVSTFNSTEDGNACLEHADESQFVLEVLYKYFNRKTSKVQSLTERIDRMSSDYSLFHQLTGSEKEMNYKDILAPKGIYFHDRACMVMDGSYYGYIGLKSDSWPLYDVPAGWLTCFSYGAMVDIDVIGKRLPSNPTKIALEQYNKLKDSDIRSKKRKGNFNRIAEKQESLNNNEQVLNAMKSGDELYDIAVILTIRASSKKQLMSYMRQIRQHMSHELKFDPYDSFLCVEDYFSLTMPFLSMNYLFGALSHNVLTSNITSLYPLISNTIYDPSGYIAGTTGPSNNEIAAINNFNTNYFENANMLIFGTSGSGKTYTLQTYGTRMFLNGIRCFCILPKKGYEYKKGCDLVNGLYVPIGPGYKTCINIMAIREEGKLDAAKVKDDTAISNKSLLATKINNLVLWIDLLMDIPLNLNETTKLNTILTDLYNEFGISEDNDSIFMDPLKKSLKTMPIIGDLYKKLNGIDGMERIRDALSLFVTGNCQNLNGQTNVDLSEYRYIVFDVDEDNIGDRLLAAFLYIPFDFVYSEIKASPDSNDIVIFDEIWRMTKNRRTAEQVQNIVKVIRGYAGGTIMATQEVKDLLGGENKEFSETLLSNSSITLLLKIKRKDMEYVEKNFTLSESEKFDLMNFRRKNGLLVVNGVNMPIHIETSTREFEFLSDHTGTKSL